MSTGRVAPRLPPSMRVFVRDWLSSNNVLLKGADGHVLVDTGYATHAPLTLALLASAEGLGGEPLSLIVNTHGHSDHVGGNAALVARYGCPIAFPAAEADHVDRWDEKALLYGYAGQLAPRFAIDRRIEPGSTQAWGGLEWRALSTPGHDMGALVFFNPEHRILLSGDALWEDGFGFVMPRALEPAAMPAARAALDLIAALDAAVVVPGHGEPFDGVGAALERAYGRLARFEADDRRAALHALKVMLAFHLLEYRAIALDALPAYLDRTGFYRDVNAATLELSPGELARTLVDGLVRAGVARAESGVLRSQSH